MSDEKKQVQGGRVVMSVSARAGKPHLYKIARIVLHSFLLTHQYFYLFGGDFGLNVKIIHRAFAFVI